MTTHKKYSGWISMLLVFSMLLALLPVVALTAWAEEECTITISLADGDGFSVAPRQYTVSADLAEDYGYTDLDDGVSVLDVAVKLHELVYGEDEEEINAALAVEDSGFIAAFMGETGGNIVGLVNGELSEDVFGDTEVSGGDRVEFFFLQDTYAYGDTYTWFEYEGQRAETLTVTAGENFDLSLQGIWYVIYGDYGATEVDVDEAEIVLLDVESGDTFDTAAFGETLGATDEDSMVTLHFDEPGTYFISATEPDYYYVMAPWLEITVEEPPADAVDTRYFTELKFAYSSGTPTEATPLLTLEPEFDPDISEYTLVVPDGAGTFYMYADTFDPDDTVKIDVPMSGATSVTTVTKCTWKSISLNIGYGGGSNVFTAYVGPGTTTTRKTLDRTYTVKVVRQLSLRDMEITDDLGGTIAYTPTFDRNTGAYTAQIPADLEGVDITVYAINTSATEQYTFHIGSEYEGTGARQHTAAIALDWDENGEMEIPLSVSYDDMDALPGEYTLTLQRTYGEAVPSISLQPESAAYLDTTEEVAALYVRALSSGPLSYQWYEHTADSNTGGAPIAGATEKTYTPAVAQVTSAEESWYYCVVTNTDTGDAATSEAACITVYPDPKPEITLMVLDSDGNVVGDLPSEGYAYHIGETPPVSLMVALSSRVEGTVYAYQWQYKNNNPDAAAGTTISGATTDTYTPDNTSDRISNYICRIAYTDPSTGSTVYVYSENSPKFTVSATAATPPTISSHPASATYTVGTTPTTLQCPTVSISGHTITYQWYAGTDGENYSAIDGATSRLFLPPSQSTAGVRYYFCRVTATLNSVSGQTYSAYADTNPAVITFVAVDFGWQGSGTEADPFQITTVDDLNAIREHVGDGTTFSDVYFTMQDNITLPSDWTPIGDLTEGATSTGVGVNILPFSGVIDGNGYTLTFPDHAEHALLRYARGATIKNLIISGTYIDCYALVESYVVDYGATGNYSTYTSGGTVYPVTIEIDNVTIQSGTNMLYSGFIGGSASGANTILIRNCTAEDGVVIGYDKSKSGIATFAGGFCGTVESSVSYAAVYGVDRVGGLISTKSQSMGDCIVSNSAFLGEIEATGSRVGGIIASGYVNDSAPATPLVTIRNCYVDAAISGVDKVGGILGDDSGFHGNYNRNEVTDNFFYGTITASGSNVGGIVGYIYMLSDATDHNNFFRVNCGAESGIGGCAEGQEIIDQEIFAASATAAEFSDGTILNKLNSSETSFQNWIQGDSYPIHSDEAIITGLELSGTYKTNYTVGDSFDTDGMTIIVKYSDGTTKTATPAEVTFSGYDMGTRGVQTVTVRYGAVETSYQITVLYSDSGSGSTPKTIRVYFTLYGDSVHDAPEEGGTTHTLTGNNLETWIARRAYTVSINATVLDVLEAAVDWANENTTDTFEIRNPSGNYMEAISKNGVELAEFTNGSLSGWMCTINGTNPTLGVSEQFLENSDEIVFHYTDDYTKEDGSEKWSSSATGGSKTPVASEEITVTAVTDETGAATASVTEEEMTAALEKAVAAAEAASDGSIPEVKVAVAITGNATSLTTSIKAASVTAIAAAENAQLTIRSSLGSVTLDSATLGGLVGEVADSADVNIKIERVGADSLTGQIAETVGDHPAFALTITVDGKTVSNFAGTVTVLLPYTRQSNEALTVYYVGEDGATEEMSNVGYVTIDGVTGCQFTTDHFSLFMIAPVAQTMSFTDVSVDDWFYEAVQYVFDNHLMTGVGNRQFAPNSALTRAMMVTVLYRCEGEPSVTATNPFDDVTDGEWYTDAVIWANESGIAGGYGGGRFGVNDNITREQVATILLRYMDWKGLDVSGTNDLTAYTDAGQISGWALDAMAWANAEGVMNGRTETTLSPQGETTRAEIAQMLCNIPV